eukprot:8056625-Alexandrium_andersonii.AAC.1
MPTRLRRDALPQSQSAKACIRCHDVCTPCKSRWGSGGGPIPPREPRERMCPRGVLAWLTSAR